MTPADHVQNDHAAANRTLRRRLVIGLISFLTLVDLFGAQALLPLLTIADDVDPGTMGLAWAYQSNLTLDEMLERPFYHPLVEEGPRTALHLLNADLAMESSPIACCLDCGPDA